MPIEEDDAIMEGTIPIGKNADGWICCEPQEHTTWLIERSLRHDGDYLTISEDGITNRPWKKEEIEKIKNKFNGRN